MSRALLTVALILFLSLLALSQAPVFETTSVKPGSPVQMPANSRLKSTGARVAEDPGRITYQNTTLLPVLLRAYDVKRRQIHGPAWLDAERYDIVATIPAGASKDQIPTMLQNLLAERFKMIVHVENRPEHIYALVAGKNPRLKESKAPGPSLSFDREGHTEFVGYTLTAFADVLTNVLDRSVVDSTELPGRYDFSTHLDLPGSNSADASDPAPSIFTAMQDLGLKLEARDGLVKHIVIDKAEKVPTAN
jgi:uncharacterized protein (TIGR03435 family)